MTDTRHLTESEISALNEPINIYRMREEDWYAAPSFDVALRDYDGGPDADCRIYCGVWCYTRPVLFNGVLT